ncbi:DUF1853 family protein [Marinomonas atlantica]|uniref:DUF1853 family protein n=1 Tax=Marinomonas atlantica TaxID=1806668 RepID=UPI0018D2A5F6|nr:DUF1853 family protein [Marinomonas atlantica]MCO4785338.1 DUF1853 family protein [Marinomonas atlantica]
MLDYPLAGFLIKGWRSNLKLLSDQPEPLVQWMAQAKSHFLGTYFEQLFSFAVQHFADVQVLAEHEQIHIAGKTYGEVDLLIKNRAEMIFQFEIALKFYLERNDLNPHCWIGPNKHDSLVRKQTHARDHQLKVLNVEEGQSWLKSFSNDTAVTPNLMIFGRHFYDLNIDAKAFFEYQKYNGGWVRLNRILVLEHFLYDLREAQKPYWITPNSIKSDKKQMNKTLKKELAIRFEDDPRPVLFSCIRKSDTSKTSVFWLFVCPDEW